MKIALTTTLEDNYVQGFLITFRSLLKTSKPFDHDLVIFEWGNLSDTNKEKIKLLYDKVIFRKVNTDLYKNQDHDDTWRKWTYNCNYRFDIFTLEEYDKVLFFDCDILFNIGIEELLEYDVDFGACQMPSYTEYNQTIGSKIFNAGLMLIGKKFLNQKTRSDLIDIANTPPPISKKINTNKWFGNQPILNNYFHDKMTWFPERFNFLTENLHSKCFEEPKNYHFIGHNKPWSGTILEEQFDKHIFDCVSKKIPNIVFCRMTFRKLIEKYYEHLHKD